ncbi:lysophospholipid acyltransferase family protein [Rhizobacter sp. J219]|uniref:lysophospholipid acyltransferase family protein n=1 Tax=Rhizobacter sp. J219 TaxID=2898430 RepID=UPI0021506D22|nr:lysophospholipid acyltransferase family protein [Rhizobacter sp. J219]MCR5883960.1 lysophospholipid acyltransferase family protein [Rhizobacter sp. J219]
MLTLFHWFAGLPLALLHALGAFLGWVTYLLSPTYRRRMVANAAQAGLRPAQWKPAIASAGRMVMELPYLWMRKPDEPILPRVRFEGEALLAAALGRGNGVLLLTPHMGCFEVAAQAIAERFGAVQPITVLYRPARQPWLRDLVRTSRERPRLHAAPASLAGVRQMIRALRKGEMVGLLPDQVPPEGMGVWAPFFGREAYTMTLATRLVQQTGAELLLTWVERLPRGGGYVQRFFPFPEPLPTDGTAAAIAINRAMEGLIRQCPQQYLWGYHRYKSPRAQAGPDEVAP